MFAVLVWYLDELRELSDVLSRSVSLCESLQALHHKLLNLLRCLLKLLHLVSELFHLSHLLSVLLRGVRKALRQRLHLIPQQSGSRRVSALHKRLHLCLHGGDAAQPTGHILLQGLTYMKINFLNNVCFYIPLPWSTTNCAQNTIKILKNVTTSTFK